MELVIGHIGEVVVGIMLIFVTWAFHSWTTSIKESNKEILAQLLLLKKDFHEYRVNTENRVTKVEEKVYHLEKTFFITLARNVDSTPQGGQS